MKKSTKKNLKFIIPMVVLVVIFLSLNIYLYKIKLNNYNSLVNLNDKIIFSTKISKLVHEIQLERGLSVSYFVNEGKNFSNKLKIQRDITLFKYNELIKYLIKSDFKNELKSFKMIILLSNLKKIRLKIDKLQYKNIEIINYYSKINQDLLNIIIEISKLSEEKDISSDINSYINFLYSKENAGLERALGVKILSINNKNTRKNRYENIIKFTNLISKQNLNNDIFYKYANNEVKKLYLNSRNLSSFKNVQIMREMILNPQNIDNLSIDVDYWFSEISSKIGYLKILDDKINMIILKSIKNKQNKIKEELSIFIVLNILGSLVTIFMMYLLFNFVKHEKYLRSIIDKNVISSITDINGIIIEASEAFCKISGYAKHELLGSTHSILKHEEMNHSLYRDMWKTILNGKVWHGEVMNKRKDGKLYWVKAIITPIFSFGKMVGFTSTREDITYKKKIEELNSSLKEKITAEVNKNRKKDQLLAQQSRLAQMGEMISMIAHQWRQPLSSISSLSISLNLKSQLSSLNKENALEISKRISENVKHLSDTIDDFREFFRKNKEERDSSYEEIITNVLKIVECSLCTKNINIIKDFSCNKVFSSYPNEIKQVVLNLIKNADDVLSEKKIKNPYIKISTYEKGNELVLEVSDNAGGIPDNIINKVFDPYFSTKMKKDGTGLGLYMSKTIIDEHCKGQLSVKNTAQGAVFSISLKNK